MAKQLKKRNIDDELTFLANGELNASFVFLLLYFVFKYIFDMNMGANSFKLNWISFYPLLVLSLLLLEGSFYWRNKLRRIKHQKAFSSLEIGMIFHLLKQVNFILLAAYTPLSICIVIGHGVGGLFVGLVLYVFAIIEYINYFHVRLSYETARGGLLIIKPMKQLLRGEAPRSQLRKDMEHYLKVQNKL